jgi:hypothetical protein
MFQPKNEDEKPIKKPNSDKESPKFSKNDGALDSFSSLTEVLSRKKYYDLD